MSCSGQLYPSDSFLGPWGHDARSVVAIHSVDEQREVAPWWHPYTYEQKYRWSSHLADRVIANSHYVKQRLIELYRVPSNKIDVIWLGVDEAFRPLDDQELMRRARVKYLGSDSLMLAPETANWQAT